VQVVMQVVMAVALLLIGALMVSTFRYNSFKKLDLRKRWSYRAFVPFAAILLVFLFIPRAILLAITLLYTFSGPVGAAVARLRPRRGPKLDDTSSPLEGAP
jgi:CDP-diacylglycerol--serine O-phosphatidyltransferase